MLGKRYLCHACGTEFDFDVTVRGHVSSIAGFCPCCGSHNVMLFPPGSGTTLDKAECYTAIRAQRELKRLLFTLWQERSPLRARFCTAARYITAVLGGTEPLPEE